MLLIFGILDKTKWKKVIPPKWFWWSALVCVFVASYGAWSDEHRNLTTVTSDKASVWGKYNQCDKELASKSVLAETLQSQASTQHANFSNQQDTFSKCVLYLAQANKPEALKQTFLMQNIDHDKTRSKHKNQIVLLTNKVVTPVNVVVVCDGTIRGIEGVILSPGNVILNAASDNNRIINRNAGIIHLTSPAWTPDTPLVVNVYYDEEDIGRCGIRQ